jgi:YHS domain-containing protein
MIRFLVILIVAIILITVIRMFAGLAMRAAGDLLQPKSPSEPAQLHKDPVCGTFVPEHSSVTKIVRGQTVHFCSDACRDKYRA